MTIVAAWIRADTGVGPSIASSSQACSGTCADLPQAARSSSRPSAVRVFWDASPETAEISAKDVVPKVTKNSAIARLSPMSPTRLITKAFLAAAAAECLCCQKPISRYDARPTPSQPRNSPT